MTIKDEYKRARQNLFRRMSAWKAKGIQVDFEMPSVPKKITRQSVERLKKVQLPKLIKSGKAISTETGEIYTPYSYEEDLKEKRAKRKKRRQFQNEVDIERKREQEDEARTPRVSTKKEQEESERMAKRYHKMAGTEVEDTFDYDLQLRTEIEDLNQKIHDTHQTVLINKWDSLRNSMSERDFAKALQDNDLIAPLQEAVGAILTYEARRAEETAQRAGFEATYYLSSIEMSSPLTADEIEEMGMSNYVE